MSNKKIYLLCCEEDRERLRPIEEKLAEKGVRVAEAHGPLKKDSAVLAVLTERFFADGALRSRLLDHLAAGGENVLPLHLDGGELPDELKNALYSRNIIDARGREPELLAERIAAALPEEKNRLPRMLTLGAAVLVLLAGLLIWRAAAGREPAPVETEPPAMDILIPGGLTAEDLEKIVVVNIVGEQAEFYTNDDVNDSNFEAHAYDYYAYRDFDGDGAHYYSREDGHEYRMTRYEDLRFLSLMTRLKTLNISLAEIDQMPDLSGLQWLENVFLGDDRIPDLEWLANSSVRKIDLLNSAGTITDYSPLTSCSKLDQVHIDLIGCREADFSGFAPERLNWLWINNGQRMQGELDLSSLAACERLNEVILTYEVPITDLSFLSGSGGLRRLELEDLSRLRDISELADKQNLAELRISVCDAIRDFSPLAQCTALQTFYYRTEGPNAFRDASFLAGLPRLKDIDLQNVDLPDVDFLREIAPRQKTLNLGLTGDFGDYSGLEACKEFRRLNLDPSPGTSFAEIVPYLEGARVQDLSLRRFAEVDLSTLPKVLGSLELDRVGNADLSTLPKDWSAVRINLNKMGNLSSLNGLQDQKIFGKNGVGQLEIFLCPRLTDWSALDGCHLSTLRITGGFTLPSFDKLRLANLELESVADVNDLSFLEGMDAENGCSFSLVGLDGLKDITPLRRFHGGMLTVSPQLTEQAKDLVDAGNFNSFRVEFPQGGWELEHQEFKLQSLEELETLPKSMLRHVTSVCVVGDRVVDRERYEIWEDWDHRDGQGNPSLTLYDRQTDEVLPVGKGSITDLSLFAGMTGLRELQLFGQPLSDLSGVQELDSLECFESSFCPQITDASPLFSLQGLRDVDLKRTGIDSIQGVQNLTELCWLDISDTGVTDLSPLGACDFTRAYEDGGLRLDLNGIELSPESLAILGGIRSYRNLNFTNQDPALWIPALADCEIYSIGAAGDLRGNEDLAAFAADHPELESIWIGSAREITDLTPLLALENLESVGLNSDMTEAIASLDGHELGFRLKIEG